MSKGGGGGGSPAVQESVVTQTNLPEYAEPYFTRLLQRAEAESLQPYRTYTGQRLAPLSSAAQRVLGRQTALGLSAGPREGMEASQIARNVAQQPIAAGAQISQFAPDRISSQYQAPQFSTDYGVERFQGFIPAERFDAQTFDTGIAQMYMNPFQRLVTDIEKREATRASDIAGEQIESRAAQTGGLGGYREAILQAERQRNLGQQLADIEARGQRDAFTQAQQQFERDRAARFGAARFGEEQRRAMEQMGLSADQFAEQQRRQAAQFGLTTQQLTDASRQFQDRQRQAALQADIDAQIRARQLGLAGLEADRLARQQQLSAAQLLAKQAPMQQQLAFDRLRAAQEAQETARNFRQAGLDMGYQDFLNQVAFPRQQLGFFSQILQGLPVTPGTQVSQYQPTPTTTQQLLGLGLGGLGLYQALGGRR
jgi:hypothetical protein|tara:strand:- start:942 stop:2219 length:1278 start_codon:yes stop_codon:yes gene_type:complete